MEGLLGGLLGAMGERARRRGGLLGGVLPLSQQELIAQQYRQAQIDNYLQQIEESKAKKVADAEKAAEEKRNKEKRDAFLAGNKDQLSPVSAMGPGGPTPQNLAAVQEAGSQGGQVKALERLAMQAHAAGLDDLAKAYLDSAKKITENRETYTDPKTYIGPDGKPVLSRSGQYGSQSNVPGLAPTPNIEIVDQGDKKVAIDRNVTAPGTTWDTGISPAVQASLDQNLAMRQVGFAQAKAMAEASRLQRLNADTQALSKQVEAAALPSLTASMRSVQEELDKYSEGQLPGVGYWASNVFPPMNTPEGRKVRAKIQAVANDLLKLYSGGAVTPNEAERRYVEMMARGPYNEKDFRNAWPLIVARVNNSLKNVRAGYSQEAIAEYTNRGGIDFSPIKSQGKIVVRTGTNTKTGKRVVEYDDGTIEEQ